MNHVGLCLWNLACVQMVGFRVVDESDVVMILVLNHCMQKLMQIVKPSSGRDSFCGISVIKCFFKKNILSNSIVPTFNSTCKIKEFKRITCLGNVLHFQVPLLKEKLNSLRSRKETEECKRLHVCIASHSYYWILCILYNFCQLF